MKRLARYFALAGALAVGALSSTACDASPYAASVNGRVISQVTLNTQLQQWASNREWVRTFDSANSQQNGGSGISVSGTGGRGTYSMKFVSDILDNLIQVRIIRQNLSATDRLPSNDELVASRAINEFLRKGYWTGFPTPLRSFLVEQLADQAPLTPPGQNQGTIRSAFSQISPYVFSRLCVTQADAVSQEAAQKLIDNGFTGANICYDQSTLEAQSGAYQDAVIKLANPGDVTGAIKTRFGYTVVRLTSKDSPGLSEGVVRVLTVATAQQVSSQVSALFNKAHVRLNPGYGKWSAGQITPPVRPGQ